MDVEQAMDLARAYLSDRIEFTLCGPEEVGGVLGYHFSFEDHWFFRYQLPGNNSLVGASQCICVKKSTGEIVGVGSVGE